MSAVGGAERWPRRRTSPASGRPLEGAIVGGLVASSALLLLFRADTPVLAFVPLGALLAVVLFFRVPVHQLVFGLGALALALDAPAGRPQDGKWKSPIYPIGRLLYENLNTITGVAPLRFSLLEVLLVLLIGRVIFDRVTHRGEEPPRPVPSVLVWALGGWLLTILWLEVFGLARGGDVRNSLWQVRALFWLPIVSWLFLMVMRTPRDFVWIARAIVAAATSKVAFGFYFLVAIARPRGLEPPYVMTHDDTLLMVAAAFVILAAWLYRPSRGHLLLMCTALPWVFVGIVINDRRIAYVSLFGGLAVMYALLGGRVKRIATLCTVLCMPFFGVYLLAGQHRTGGVWTPAAKIMSVVQQKDASSSTRDIENYNLYVTLRAKGRLFGSGFGHEYIESVAAYDISGNFAQYRYIAHNSVLWLWSIGGLVGITSLWFALVVAVYLAARSFRRARTPIEQTAAVTVITVVLTYLVQAWGDMGTQSWVGVWVLASMFATAGRLAADTGAWPATFDLFRPRRVALPAPEAEPSR